ncbi:unnamed protein product [Agarophyton chilense]
MTQIAVSVHYKSSSLVRIQNHPKTVLKHLTLMANGVMDIQPKSSFLATISNFRDKPVRLPNVTVIGITLPEPVAIMEAQVDILATQTPEEDVESWEGTIAIGADFESYGPQDDARPQFQHPYRTGLKGREIVADQMEKMCKDQVIEPGPPNRSEWASTLVLVAKKDGSVRICVDYRKLNALSKRDSYPIPVMDECLDSLGKAVVFNTLEANSGYLKIPLAEDARALTTFTTHEGLFRFTRMPFGLKNAPATFQRVMDIILSRVKWKPALVYLDDFIIFSRTVKEHFRHVKKVLTILQDAGVTQKLRKCAFFQASVDYLGHVVLPGKLKVATRTTNAIRQAKPPRTHT